MFIRLFILKNFSYYIYIYILILYLLLINIIIYSNEYIIMYKENKLTN